MHGKRREREAWINEKKLIILKAHLERFDFDASEPQKFELLTPSLILLICRQPVISCSAKCQDNCPKKEAKANGLHAVQDKNRAAEALNILLL